MTSRERLLAVYAGRPADRIPVKLWGLDAGQGMMHPAYKPVYDLAMEKTDLIGGAGSPMDMYVGRLHNGVYEGAGTEPRGADYTANISLIHTPKGDMRSVYITSNHGHPGMTEEYYIKDERDLEKMLSLAYEPYPADITGYVNALAAMGERGMVMFGLDHPCYALHRLVGSETLGYLLYDAPELVEELVRTFAKRMYDHVKAILDAGIAQYGPFAFCYVGPEVIIPPLVSNEIFERLVYTMDKPYLDLIKNAGGYVWVHCHGKVGKLISRFADMGVDVLNPIEPPPMGDVTVEQAISAAGGRITLEGNIEINDIINQDEEYIRAFLENTVRAGSEYGRFILCPSAGYMEYVYPSEKYIKNLQTYISYGLELSEKYARK